MSTRGASVPRCFMRCHFGDSTVRREFGGEGKGREKKQDEWRRNELDGDGGWEGWGTKVGRREE